jgi:Lon protease-like protein
MVCQSDAENILRNSSVQDYVICIPLATSKRRGENGQRTKTHSTDLSQLFHYGCVAKVIECDRSLPNICVLKVQGICRSRIRDISSMDGGEKYEALLEHYPDTLYAKEDDQLVFQNLVDTFIEKMRLIGVSGSVLNKLSELVTNGCPISYVANLLMCITDASFGDKLRVLELSDMKEKLEQVNHAVNRYLQVKKIIITLTRISIYA